MFRQLPDTKVFRDPIHGYIKVDLELIWSLIDTYAFQRLRRIHQLGGTYMVYHTAEHSRFSHSLGVYEIVRRMVSEVKPISSQLTQYDKVTAMLAGLLHDIGHGPFSHAFEAISQTHHEAMTIRILLEDTTINQILRNVDENLPSAVAKVIEHTHENKLLCQLVSGQLDADRMDYLLRDSYFTGTSYGNFDLERVLRTLRVQDQQLVVKESGIHTIEDYIMSRYHMYWQVYFHPLGRSYEAMLAKLFQRLRYLHEKGLLEANYPMFLPFLKNGPIDVHDYLAMDEPAAFYGIQLMTKGADPILRDLARRILERDLFTYEVVDDQTQIENQRQIIEECGFDPAYYFHHDKSSQVPYLPYVTRDSDVIEVLRADGRVVELSEISLIVSSIIRGKAKDDWRMFFPEECHRESKE